MEFAIEIESLINVAFDIFNWIEFIKFANSIGIQIAIGDCTDKNVKFSFLNSRFWCVRNTNICFFESTPTFILKMIRN